MYDTKAVLESIDQNATPILALCSFAMACNYYYFFTAAMRGFRDKVYPLPVFSVLFWLCGDGSFVLDYNLAFNVINHWYVKLFWVALLFTVAFELLYLFMIIRFGRKEIAPQLTQPQFTAAILGGFVVMAVVWSFIKSLINDPLAINYFHIANLAGPPFVWALYNRRQTRAGTTPSTWVAYTLLVISWGAAAALYFGAPFNAPQFLLLYAVTIAACIAVTLKVMRLPAAPEPSA